MLVSTVSTVSTGGVWDGWLSHAARGTVDVNFVGWTEEEDVVLVEMDLPPLAMDPMMMGRASQDAV